MNTKQKIEALLNSGISGYAIAKESGVTQSSVNRIMNGEYDLDKISLGNSEKLAKMFDKRVANVELSGQNKAIKEVLRSEFREILESQLDLWEEGRIDDERFTFWVLYEVFSDILNDNIKIAELAEHINSTNEPSQSVIDEL
ncbi:helix-turn-helix transcriptional regulator [Leuconostocaceae bacterium ESL0958]|nr:helix-turn-helix transcriptional regulator [Leuconostocaceae bacterium ESL0958]